MQIQPLATPTNLYSARATQPSPDSAAAADSAEIGKAPANQRAEQALAVHSGNLPAARANERGWPVLEAIQKNPSTPTEGAVARAVYTASKGAGLPSTHQAMQQAAFTRLAAGVSNSATANLSEIGLAMATAARQPGETRRLGYALMDELRQSADTAGERSFAQAVIDAVPVGDYVTNESGANVLKAGFEMLSQGLDRDSDQAIATLGSRLPELASDVGNAAKMGAKLFGVMAESGDNKNAQAGKTISSKYAVASQELMDKQQDLFGHVLAGTESQYASPAFSLEASPNTTAVATGVAALALQGAMLAVSPHLPGGPAAGWLLTTAIGGVAFAGVKGVYNGLLAQSKAEAGGPSKGFGHAFKVGFKANIWSSLIHSTVQRASLELVGMPYSFLVGPAMSAALNRYTPFG